MTSAATLIHQLTYPQYKVLLDDALQMMQRCSQLAERQRPLTELLPRAKYRAVLNTLDLALHQKEESHGHFLRGLAAALYSLARLDEANALVGELGPALGLTGSPPDAACTTDSGEAVYRPFSLEDLSSFLVAEGFENTLDQDGATLIVALDGNESLSHLAARAHEDRCLVSFALVLRLLVPKNRLAETADAVARANWSVELGHFELDMDEARLGYWTSLPVDETWPSAAQLRHCLFASFSAVERYIRPLQAVALENAIAAETIKYDEPEG